MGLTLVEKNSFGESMSSPKSLEVAKEIFESSYTKKVMIERIAQALDSIREETLEEVEKLWVAGNFNTKTLCGMRHSLT